MRIGIDYGRCLMHVHNGTHVETGGQVFMPFQAYPFARKFAWPADEFGVSWQLNLPND